MAEPDAQPTPEQLADRAEGIADGIAQRRAIGGYSGLSENTRRIARAAALAAARVALGLPAYPPYVHPDDRTTNTKGNTP